MVFINTNLCFQSSKVKMNIFFPLFEQRHKTYLLCRLFCSDSDHPNADNSSFPNLYPHCLLKPFFSFFCLLLSILYSFSNFFIFYSPFIVSFSKTKPCPYLLYVLNILLNWNIKPPTLGPLNKPVRYQRARLCWRPWTFTDALWTTEPYFLPAVRIIESKHRTEVNELLPQPVEHLHHLKNDRRRWTVIFRTNWTPFQFPPPLPYPPSVTLGCVAVCSDILLQQPMVGASPDWFFMPTEQQLILAGMQRGSSSGRQQL